MGLTYQNLDDETRRLMLDEIDSDIAGGKLYISDRLSAEGARLYTELLRKTVRIGDDATLRLALRAQGVFNEFEVYTRKGVSNSRKMSLNAPDMLAEGEFNRFYIRAICRRAIESGLSTVEVYRAKQAIAPRAESEAQIGMHIGAHKLLKDLRESIGIDTALGIPAGPNSGLSVRLP